MYLHKPHTYTNVPHLHPHKRQHNPTHTHPYLLPPQVDAEGSRKELVVSERQAALTEAVKQFQPGQVVRGQVGGCVLTLKRLSMAMQVKN